MSRRPSAGPRLCPTPLLSSEGLRSTILNQPHQIFTWPHRGSFVSVNLQRQKKPTIRWVKRRKNTYIWTS